MKGCSATILSTIFALSSPSIPFASETDRILSVVNSMEQAWSGVSDYTMQVEKTERLINGRETWQVVHLKFRQPNRYYLKVLEGKGAGAELIFPKSEEEPVAIAHPGGMKGKLARLLQNTVVLSSLAPTEFSLRDPSIVRGQHQTVLESNLGRTIELIARNIRTAIELGEGELRIDEVCAEAGQCLYRIDVELPPSVRVIHEVRESESLWTLSARYELPMYVIWYNNPEMRDPNDIRPGQSVIIPRYYASRGHIWISRDSGLLAKLEIFDAEGKLYERYTYSAIETNIGLSDEAFDVDNPDYGF